MKNYKIVDRYKFYEFVIIIIMTGVILISNNAKNTNYKNEIMLTNEQQEFIRDWNGIPNELKEWMDICGEDFEYLDIPLDRGLQRYTYKMSKKHGMDYLFVLSIMKTESEFKVDAKSKNNTDNFLSIGLMQLNERYISEFSEITGIKYFDINNVYHNIEGGIAKLAQLEKQWSRYDLTEESKWYAITNAFNLGYTKYKNQVISRGGFFSREYDRRVLENKMKLEENYYE